MTDLYKAFETNAELEEDGVWLDFGDNTRMKVAHAGETNDQYVAKMSEVAREHEANLRVDSLTPKQNRDAMIEAYAAVIVKGWEGVNGRDGKSMSFSKSNVVKLFTDLPHLFRTVRDHAENFAHYRQNKLKDDAKNSDTASGGN